ncbi:MAG: hypothetical protein ACK5YG_00125 [Alphaproteobacteria bacterium]
MSALAIGEATPPAPAVPGFEGRVAAVDVTLSPADRDAMDSVVAAVHALVMSPYYQDHVLRRAPPLARCPMQPDFGLFSGYDFHLTPAGPKLIEINTNAGGAFHGALMDDARHGLGAPGSHPLAYWSDLFVRQVRNEWARAGQGDLGRVAIVDDAPDTQFLRLEFQLAARELKAHGIEAIIADPRELSFRGGVLRRRQERIDLVYNRLTSFSLDRPEDAPLRDALEAGAAWITPGPRAHALLAAKQNLALMGDEAFLAAAGLDAKARAALVRAVPKTIVMSPENSGDLWARRDEFYFKPMRGYGSRGVYAGAKLTRRTWEAIAAGGDYVAQALVPPSRVPVPGHGEMRCDIRTFAYEGRAFMRLARLYRGQTTNFRTPGGGFAAVVSP